MVIISSKIGKSKITAHYNNFFKTVIKVVVDVEKEIIALDAELHADLEALLLENGSKQEDLWGINLYPFKDREDFIEYTALINIRPSRNNPSMEIEDQKIKEKVKRIVEKLIDYEA